MRRHLGSTQYAHAKQRLAAGQQPHQSIAKTPPEHPNSARSSKGCICRALQYPAMQHSEYQSTYVYFVLLSCAQAADFPGVDFSLMQHSTDEAWQALHDALCHDGGCYLTGEAESHCERRALDFYAWIMNRYTQGSCLLSCFSLLLLNVKLLVCVLLCFPSIFIRQLFQLGRASTASCCSTSQPHSQSAAGFVC